MRQKSLKKAVFGAEKHTKRVDFSHFLAVFGSKIDVFDAFLRSKTIVLGSITA